jgi:ferrous iron transport protein A
MTLRDMNIGDKAKVIGLQKGNKTYRKKLLAMGLTPGTEFSVTRYAPMGDPVEIHLRGFALSLRKNEAAPLLIERLEQ